MLGRVHEGHALLLFGQCRGWKIIEQRPFAVAEQRRCFQHMVDIGLLQHQPMTAGGEVVAFPDEARAVAQLIDGRARCAVSEVGEIQQRTGRAAIHR